MQASFCQRLNHGLRHSCNFLNCCSSLLKSSVAVSPDPDVHTDIPKRDSQPEKAKQENGCRREDFIVHTKDLGLSTKLMRPESFNVYQCKGKCSLTPGQKFFNHWLLKAYLQKMKGIKTDREACCVPTKQRPVYFIYYTEKRGTFVMRTYRDMIVEECGCY